MDDHRSGTKPGDTVRIRRSTALPPGARRFDTDERLVAAVRDGSEEAFGVLYDRHVAAVRGLCRTMLGSFEADDAVQHAFTAAFVDMSGSDKRIVLRPWLLTIARHRCLTVIAGRRASRFEPLDPRQAPALTQEVDVREDLRAVMDDIARLPEEQRVALVLREIGGASYTEIAQIGEVSQPRARTLVFQARSSLRASRRAREIPCEEIRLLLAKSRGGELRRSVLRHHLRQCQGCRAFAVELRARRRGLKCLLPLMPIAAFRRTALGSFLTSGGGGGAALVGEGVAAKALATGAIVIGGGVAGIAGSNAPGTAPEAPRMALVATKAPLDHRRATAGGSTDRHQRSTGTAHTPERGIAERRTAAPKRPSGISQPASPPPTHENAGRVAAADTPTAPSGGGAKPDVGPADPKDPATKPEKDDPGASGEAPAAGGGAAGAPGTPPGQSGSAPGQSGSAPGQSGPPLGQSGSAPGQSGSAPGQSGPPLGQSGPPPGQNGGPPPGQSGPPPGNGGSPGNNGGGGSPRNGGGSGDGPA